MILQEKVLELKIMHTIRDMKIFKLQRGTEINVIIPNVAGLDAGHTKIYSQDIQIGVLSELSAVENSEKIYTGNY